MTSTLAGRRRVEGLALAYAGGGSRTARLAEPYGFGWTLRVWFCGRTCAFCAVSPWRRCFRSWWRCGRTRRARSRGGGPDAQEVVQGRSWTVVIEKRSYGW